MALVCHDRKQGTETMKTHPTILPVNEKHKQNLGTIHLKNKKLIQFRKVSNSKINKKQLKH